MVPADATFVQVMSGWSTTGNAGVFQPTASAYAGGPPAGQQVAYLNQRATMQQTLPGYTLSSGDTLTLRVRLGWRQDKSSVGVTRMELLAQPLGSLLASQLVNQAALVRGGFTLFEMTATVPAPLAGQNLMVQIAYDGTTQQINVDEVEVRLLA